MAIVTDEKNGRYYISYHLKMENGTFRTVNIKNKDWTLDKGKRFMQRIESSEILSDREKRSACLPKGWGDTLANVLKEYVADEYRRRKRQTAYGKDGIVKNYLATLFPQSETVERSLTPANIENFKAKVASKGHTVNWVNNILGVLRQVIDFACDHDSLSYEKGKRLMSLVKSVRNTSSNEAEGPIVFWTTEEWDKFMATFSPEDRQWKVFFETAYYGALRISEVIALTWADVMFDRKKISVNKSMDKSGNVTTTKNASSNANVSLPTFVADDLKALMAEEMASPSDYCFFVKHLARTTIMRKMEAHRKAAGIKHIKFHGLRHSIASRLINGGANVLVVSKHLRHASTQQTLDTYAHLFPSITDGLMDRL